MARHERDQITRQRERTFWVVRQLAESSYDGPSMDRRAATGGLTVGSGGEPSSFRSEVDIGGELSVGINTRTLAKGVNAKRGRLHAARIRLRAEMIDPIAKAAQERLDSLLDVHHVMA
jgi:hypothetical protein